MFRCGGRIVEPYGLIDDPSSIRVSNRVYCRIPSVYQPSFMRIPLTHLVAGSTLHAKVIMTTSSHGCEFSHTQHLLYVVLGTTRAPLWFVVATPIAIK